MLVVLWRATIDADRALGLCTGECSETVVEALELALAEFAEGD